MYKLKQAMKRGSALAGAVGLLAGITSTALPMYASADSLNPLTERSLTLSSASPGWAFTDGSGNDTYAGPNTGTNGKKTGNTFSFRTSSTGTIKAFTFQYCTRPAGECQAPGNNTGNKLGANDRGSDTTTTSDLNIHLDGTTNEEVSSSDYDSTIAGGATGTAAYGDVKQVPDAQDTTSPYDHSAFGDSDDSNGIAGNYVVLYGSAASGKVTAVSDGWALTASNKEESTATQTGKVNMMTLTNGTGLALAPGDYVKIIFFGTDKNYITNPGAGAFFVKINDFDVDGSTGGSTSSDIDPTVDNNAHLIDGGVTVANVMNESIAIQTKVLETMDFSVGTVDPDTLDDGEISTATSGARTTHGACDPVLPNMGNTYPHNILSMGDATAENSLQTDKTFATHSYWRLSSNSSGGATVYYAGNTLTNTEGDAIDAIGKDAQAPLTANEQFGLALDNGTSGNYEVNYDWAGGSAEQGADADAASAGAALDSGWTTYQSSHSPAVHTPQLYPLVPIGNSGTGVGYYGGGTGGINTLADPDGAGPLSAESIGSKYAFDPGSQTVPTALATESSQVVDCVTGKMRYIGNIAATTPAGIYTTKINYIASPQY